jgi:hypothetical protein
LNGELSQLQGKWQWIGSISYTESIGSIGGGQVTIDFVSASQFTDEYFIEFERKGHLTYIINNQKVEDYRLVLSTSNENCGYYEDCRYASFYLNNDEDNQLAVFYSTDSLTLGSGESNPIPLQTYEGAYFRTTYSHQFVRIN